MGWRGRQGWIVQGIARSLGIFKQGIPMIGSTRERDVASPKRVVVGMERSGQI